MTTDQHLEKLTEIVAALASTFGRYIEATGAKIAARDAYGIAEDLKHIADCFDTINERDDTPEYNACHMKVVMRTDRKVKRWLKTELRTDGKGRCAAWVRYPAWAESFMDQSKDDLKWVLDVYTEGIPTRIVKFVPEVPL